MGEQAADADRGRDLERLLTFIDAVVAIAMTLLVLPLVELTNDVSARESVADLLRHHQPQIWSFLLSFAVISRLWFAQHYSFSHVLYTHKRVASLLVFWSLTIVFLPFPTALVARAGDQATTKILYIGTILVSTIALAVIDRTVIANPQITDGDGLPDFGAAVMNAGLLALALVISLVFPATSYFPLLLLFLDPPLRVALRRVRRRI